MKYIILVGDGMADYPLSQLKGKTPLEAARIPNMDFIAKNGFLGKVQTVPSGYPAGSDVANLSIFGYAPEKYYTGRAPLEASSMGIKILDDETAFRCNLVTVNNGIMADFTAGHIHSEEAKKIILHLQEKIGSFNIKFYPGVSYRNLAIIKGDYSHTSCTPPHDITDQEIKTFLPKDENSELIFELMDKSKKVLMEYFSNNKLHAHGKQANMIWLWGQGKDTAFPTFKEKYGLTGGVITAVDLIKGIGKKAGLEIVNVHGATGYLDTNYEGKANAALKILEKDNFVFLHVEAPDEASHEGSLEKKIQAIEDFDKRVVGVILDGLKRFSDYRIMVLPDHPTPIKIKTHTKDPVPFAIMGNKIKKGNAQSYNEIEADKNHEIFKGEDIMRILTSGNIR